MTDVQQSKWHALSSDEAITQLEASPDGLSQEQVSQRLSTCGPNKLPEAPQASGLTRFLKQFANLLVIVLMVAGILTQYHMG